MRPLALAVLIACSTLLVGCAEFEAAWTPVSPPSATRYVSYSARTFDSRSLTVVMDTSRFEIDNPKGVEKYLAKGAPHGQALYLMLHSQMSSPFKANTSLQTVSVVGPAARIPDTMSLIGIGQYSHMGVESDYVVFVDSLRQYAGVSYSPPGPFGPPTSSAYVSHVVYCRLWDNQNHVLMAEGEVLASASGSPPFASGLFSKASRALGESIAYEFGLETSE